MQIVYLVARLASADVRRGTAWLPAGRESSENTPGRESLDKILSGGLIV